MLTTKNLLKPAHGAPVATPSRDLVWTAYAMTTALAQPEERTLRAFADVTEVLYAYETKSIGLREWIRVRGGLKPGSSSAAAKELTTTMVGRVLVNQVLPGSMPFMNQPLGKKEFGALIRLSIEMDGQEKTALVLDQIKDLCFKYATLLSYSWGMADLPNLPEKRLILEEGDLRVREVQDYYTQGLLTQAERHNAVVKIWNEVKDRVADLARKALPSDGPVFSMIESGARGSWGQLTQMVGIKGLVSNPSGESLSCRQAVLQGRL